jgi:hypothetical protein
MVSILKRKQVGKPDGGWVSIKIDTSSGWEDGNGVSGPEILRVTKGLVERTLPVHSVDVCELPGLESPAPKSSPMIGHSKEEKGRETGQEKSI